MNLYFCRAQWQFKAHSSLRLPEIELATMQSLATNPAECSLCSSHDVTSSAGACNQGCSCYRYFIPLKCSLLHPWAAAKLCFGFEIKDSRKSTVTALTCVSPFSFLYLPFSSNLLYLTSCLFHLQAVNISDGLTLMLTHSCIFNLWFFFFLCFSFALKLSLTLGQRDATRS